MSTAPDTEAAGSPDRDAARRRAARLEWATLLFTVSSVTVTYFVLGGSQAMQTAWAEDLLSLIPPAAFLIAQRIDRRPATDAFPYGFHRASAVGHLVAATALTAVGAFLVVDGAGVLLAQERPPIGLMVVLGQPVWQGWLMIAALVYSASVPAVLGRLKLRVAPLLHDKVLFADAQMNKADWMTAVGAALGILGIGMGLWWADAVAALVISVSVLRDGLTTMRGAVHDLMDARATTVDNAEPLPLVGRLDAELRRLPGVGDVDVRVRDMGQVFHVDVRVVPRGSAGVTVADVEEIRRHVAGLDGRIQEVLVMPVGQVRRH